MRPFQNFVESKLPLVEKAAAREEGAELTAQQGIIEVLRHAGSREEREGDQEPKSARPPTKRALCRTNQTVGEPTPVEQEPNNRRSQRPSGWQGAKTRRGANTAEKIALKARWG